MLKNDETMKKMDKYQAAVANFNAAVVKYAENLKKGPQTQTPEDKKKRPS